MTQGKRFGLSALQKSDMWRRWKAGQSLHEIGRAFGGWPRLSSEKKCVGHRLSDETLSGAASLWGLLH
jgi:hypothetical protein